MVFNVYASDTSYVDDVIKYFYDQLQVRINQQQEVQTEVAERYGLGKANAIGSHFFTSM